jgi:hypothetical protein
MARKRKVGEDVFFSWIVRILVSIGLLQDPDESTCGSRRKLTVDDMPAKFLTLVTCTMNNDCAADFVEAVNRLVITTFPYNVVERFGFKELLVDHMDAEFSGSLRYRVFYDRVLDAFVKCSSLISDKIVETLALHKFNIVRSCPLQWMPEVISPRRSPSPKNDIPKHGLPPTHLAVSSI